MTLETKAPRLFSYVVHHDYGFAPCIDDALCSLSVCKYSKSGRPNIVELARIGDWIAGTGGASEKSAGHGRLVYAMRVTGKMSLAEYVSEGRFRRRKDAMLALENPIAPSRLALLSTEFWYFGSNAPNIEDRSWNRDAQFEKRGPGYRSKFAPGVIAEFERWLRGSGPPGVYGSPCRFREHAVVAPIQATPVDSTIVTHAARWSALPTRCD